MPRNYSINDTIQQAKDEIHRKKMKKLQDDSESKKPTPTLMRFNHPEPEKENKKWYQFWK